MEKKLITIADNKTIQVEKERKERVIVRTNSQWETDAENQYEIMKTKQLPEYGKITGEIRKKLSGYKSQDKIKEKYNPGIFVDLEYTLNLLESSDYQCYYCKERVLLLYSFVRDPKQWSLERLDNDYGHNKNNVVLACLSCNLQRRTMYHERFTFTKQLDIRKLDHGCKLND